MRAAIAAAEAVINGVVSLVAGIPRAILKGVGLDLDVLRGAADGVASAIDEVAAAIFKLDRFEFSMTASAGNTRATVEMDCHVFGTRINLTGPHKFEASLSS